MINYNDKNDDKYYHHFYHYNLSLRFISLVSLGNNNNANNEI